MDLYISLPSAELSTGVFLEASRVTCLGWTCSPNSGSIDRIILSRSPRFTSYFIPSTLPFSLLISLYLSPLSPSPPSTISLACSLSHSL